MDSTNHIGQQIGNYRLTEAIASGSFGSVYKAEHIHLSWRLVAIKLLHTYLGSQAERDQFTREAQFLAQLDHPSILPLLDFGFSDGQPYLITRYAVGGSLRQKLKQQKRLPLVTTLTILQQIGNALHFAHERNIVHRDLKPENILFNERDEALLADFGIAIMLATTSVQHLNVITGTPPYMAPEQFKGTISKEGDQYALGCIAYELLTGQPPFRSPDFVSMGFKHLTEPPIPPRQFDTLIPPAIEAAVLKALGKQRTERHADIPAFLAALSELFTQPTILPTPMLSAPLPAPSTIFPTQQAGPWAREQWLEQGNTYNNEQRYEVALIAYDQALLLDPNYDLAHHNKGAALEGLQRYEEALVAYDQALLLNPNYTSAYIGKGNVLQGLQRYEEALAAYEQALLLDPMSAFAHCGRGKILHGFQRYEEALVAYDQVLRLDPNYDLAHHNKGAALEGLQRYEEALVAYEQALLLNSNYTSAYYGKGNALHALQHYEEALTAYEQALLLDPSFALAYHSKGIVLNNLQHYEEALTACEQALLLDHNCGPAYHNKGVASIGLQHYEEALTAYEQALLLDPMNAFAHCGKGIALNGLQRYEEALTAYEQALLLDPEDAGTYNNKGVALENLQRYEEALAACEQALCLDPNLIEAWQNKGDLLKILGRKKEARAAYAKVRKLGD